MNYYEVAPANRQYHGASLLTYGSPSKLAAGQIIVVKIRSKPAAAFVVSQVSKPTFKTVLVEEAFELRLTLQQLELFKWLLSYYPAPVGVIAQLFLPLPKTKDYQSTKPKEDQKTVVAQKLSNSQKLDEQLSKTPNTGTSLKDNETAELNQIQQLQPLTKEQREAVKVITQSETRASILHGDTGTGKTRVYIELAQKAIKVGRSVLVLVPEIALSPQIVNSFRAALSVPVIVTHSGLTPVQRRNAWLQVAHSSEPIVVIGPRSALFTPIKNVGLVVVDEFHETAYKQDQAPYYQTLRAAGKFARLNNALLVMGSATPPVGEYYIAGQKNLPIVRMTEKAAKTEAEPQLKTTVVNLKDEGERTRHPLISKTLVASVTAALARQEQVLLFLNKRGSARVILCQNCGWHAVCERCDLPMTYHADGHRLQCHTCGARQPAPSVCPECSSYDIIFKSPGTKAITDAIEKLFPDANVARFDKDNLKAEKLETRHSEIISGEIDILVGTQLLAKGHDLPRLSLVGILMAENELQFPDYTSGERSYQLMRQLIGRVGRGHRAGEVVIQTYDPENEAIKGATGQKSWQEFYKAQIAERQLFEFPPFFHLMKIEISRARIQTVTSTCEQIIKFVAESGEPVRVTGPAPSFIEKRNNTYNWQIVVKAKQRSALERLAVNMPIKCTVNLDPANLL